ncbi:Predicted dehydrogenase [Robiginitalea myxolifaciens]|uniref:Predicted dehydrogenase n=1 Tax=Robiginitalea myxolifaciens TaxID=400055 RepID=A0A1I6H5U3_9FLAO|nr:Gfo/Idh/MocA family oxidoreductase [Robiginitalea myxolifaciens]SFR49849.1 Predicted dehydrogenase [Robiginitalea myxolifaciens]
MKKYVLILLAIMLSPKPANAQNAESQTKEVPLKIAVIGLTHTHVHWIFDSEKRGGFEIVAIVEPNRDLARRYAEQHGYSMNLVYPDSQSMLKAVTPEAVTAFGTIYEHLEVVETFAPLGIHVMVEKPLAVSMEHAQRMAELARTHGIYLLTNYETTWYPSNHLAYRKVVQEGTIGDIRKVVIRDGHRGPKKIGINAEFLDWLTDPMQNGGGALTDFGCYGANLLTWLHQGRRPVSVTALTQQLQAENNPKVEDEAIILVEYPNAVGIIQGSWNWPIGRKDMEIYGLTGAVFADNRNSLRIRMAEGYDGFKEEAFELEERPAPINDPFTYFAGVIRGTIPVAPADLSALENNLVVVEILDAARESASSGQRIYLNQEK